MSNPAIIYPAGTTPYPLDRAFYVSLTGSDATGDGSIAKPFATIGKADTAITVARYTRATTSNDAILVLAGNYPFHWAQSINNDNCVIAAAGVTLTDRAILNCDQTGFNIAGHKGIHFVGIDIRATARDPDAAGYAARVGGVGFNCIRNAQGVGCDDVTFDNCCAWWFGQGISFLGDNGQKLRVWNCSLCHNYENTNGMPVKSQGIYHEGATADIRNNVIAFNGWTGKEDFANPAVVTALMFSHGCYCSMSHNPTPGTDVGNFYVCNAASGLQLRTGGLVYGDVFSANGVACDVFTDGAVGDILGNLVLGNRESAFPFTGGGLLGQSEHQTITGNTFLRSNPTTAAAITLGWNGTGNDITGTLKPSAASVGAVSGNAGVYPGPVSFVPVPRAFQTLSPNPIVKPAGTIPDLIDWAQAVGYAGAPAHAAIVAWLRDNPTKADAGGCIAWGSAQAAKLTAAPATSTGTTQPAPVLPITFSVQVDATGKVSFK